MIITILNGNPGPTPFDAYLAEAQSVLEAAGHSVTRIDLRDLPLRYCIGCWGCWVKTPGQCSNADSASVEMDRAVINADFLLWAAPLKMGYPSALLKMAMDKHLPLIHPYMVVDQGEAHHLKRYTRYPRVGLLVEKEAFTDEVDLQIVTAISCRTALNFKTRLEFSLTTETPVQELARRILVKPPRPLPLPGPLTATVGMAIRPPSRLTLFNGSPRGKRGNTPIFLSEFARGFGGPSETHHLIQVKQTERFVQAFTEAECAWIGFPLYTDAMPGSVKHFIEALEPLVGRKDNPPVGFLVQSGFPEGLHSRYVERYLERLAARLGGPYLGTIVRGNGEGVRMMPPDATSSLFTDLQLLGAGLAGEGKLDSAALARIAAPERYPSILGPVFQAFLRLPIAHGYFDGMLKKNGVYARRFERPFEELEGNS
ncbi:MAG TPA: NAD(P)H-dependent oxidoreductase [Anaerolineales bacterium]|nr:NAD(P)H-dependent oxidoreductase [Anaerolineales bacterium]